MKSTKFCPFLSLTWKSDYYLAAAAAGLKRFGFDSLCRDSTYWSASTSNRRKELHSPLTKNVENDSMKHRQLVASITRLPSTGQNECYGNILLYEISVISIMVSYFDCQQLCLMEKNVPIAFILSSRWQDGAESLGIECTSCLCTNAPSLKDSFRKGSQLPMWPWPWPLYTQSDLQYIIPPFQTNLSTKNIFSSLYKRFNFDIYWRMACFDINKQNVFVIVIKKHLHWAMM